MKASEMGERALIAHIAGSLSRHGHSLVIGAGEDDCAVIDTGGEDYLLATTDMLHRKTDFPPAMTGRQIGWMSVAVNLSDLASKGARPLGVLMAIGIPPETDLGFIEEVVKGMDECARKFGTQIIGGDTDAHDELTMTGTALGAIRKDLLVRRKGAKPGDLVCVTGRPGLAGLALLAIQKNIPVGWEILNALFEPVPRIKEGMALAGSYSVTSMMDLSDGLSLSLHDMSRAGGTGFKIYENKLPALPDVSGLKKEDLMEATLFAGGDFELLFTVAPEKLEKAKEICPLSVIGEVIETGVFIERSGRSEKLQPRGYEHFSTIRQA